MLEYDPVPILVIFLSSVSKTGVNFVLSKCLDRVRFVQMHSYLIYVALVCFLLGINGLGGSHPMHFYLVDMALELHTLCLFYTV